MTRLLVLIVAATGPARAADTKGPNVLFLFADDQRADTIAALGNTHIKTPNLDRLVKRGLAFDRAYMQGGFQGATCVPSRAMLLSGQSLFRVDEKLLRDETWPEAFGKAGYTTFISGKWHNGEKSLVRSFQEARGIFSGGMTNPMKAILADVVDGKLGTPKLAPKHACAVFADEAIGFLNRKHDRPFFCYVPFDAPHDPHVVPEDFPVRYDPDNLPLPANILPQHPFNNGEMTIRDEALFGWPRDPKKVREILAEYYRYISYLDAEIGRVLDALEKSPHADNTIVVFAADSGVARGSHGLIGKQNLYEHSVRVPLVIAGPGVAKGQRTAAMCYLFDVLPTLGKWCGVTAPLASEGREFTATLADAGHAGRPNLVFAYRNVQRVIVYGATPGGVCAAIAAAREGVSVILLEPTDHVGGLSTGGLSHCDSNQMVRSTLMGLFDEWHARVVKDYTSRGLKAPYNPAVKDQALWVFEPHVAMRVTKAMLAEAGVKVLVNERLKSVKKSGSRLVSLITKNGFFNAKVYIDSTYEGDLMAEAGVDWTIGREGRAEYDEPLAGKQYPKKKMEINGFDDQGKLLPLLTSEDGGDVAAGDRNIMTYSFRLCLTADLKNRVPMPKPEKYDPARFEIIRRYVKAGGDVKQIGFDLYPMPGDKLDGNNSIGRQFSIGLIGGANGWHTADEDGRKAIWDAHKQYTLEFYQFITTDPVVPKTIQNTYARLGLCKDEFAIYNHFSPALYVRESRRMKGLYVISQKDILTSPKKDDPIAISSFPIDSHDVQRIAFKGGGVVNEGTIFPVRKKEPKQGYAYHVPYRSVVPKPEQCVNLLVPVALSCTHVGMSSLRIEGAWMVIGQGTGVAAALAANEKVTVQEVPYEKLRKRLVAQGQVLDLPAPTKTESR